MTNSMFRFGLAVLTAGMTWGAAAAADLSISVTRGGSDTITVVPCGATLTYEVTGALSDTSNLGLAGFSFDLQFSGGPLDPAGMPVADPMLNFARPAGMTAAGGFGGTAVGGKLLVVGGAQNTANNTPDNAPFPIGTVITGVAHTETVLVTGSITAPVAPGTYTLALSNLAGTVIVGDDQATGYWVVEPTGVGTIGNLTVVVPPADPPATASNTGPVCDGLDVTLLGGPDDMASYSWTGPGGFTSAQQSPIISPAVRGIYTLTVTDGNDCIDRTATAVAVIPGPCEVFADCNDNGVYDECDIDAGTSHDCNANGVPDACDIADGTSTDSDGDGVPDECFCDLSACDDGNLCTTEECIHGECANTPNSLPCDDADPCTTNDRCIATWCIGDRVDVDKDCNCDLFDICPGRPDCRFDPNGSCPEVAYHLAILQGPSELYCGDQADCTTNDPPASCEEVVACADFVVEVWVTKFSPAPGAPGISCAYVDLLSHIPVAHVPAGGANCSIEYGAAFSAGPDFETGTCIDDGGVDDLGSCALTPGGAGVWPEWALVARVSFEQVHGGSMHFELQESTLGASVFGQGFAEELDYGEACLSTIDCRGAIYDVDSDCYIGPGDLGLFAGCWLMCPDDPGYDTGLLGGSCDGANFAKCGADDCVGPEDFSFFMTAWQKYCNDLDIGLPNCDGARAVRGNFPPLPSAELLRSFGLEPPTANWKGYERGMLREMRRLETERGAIKDRSSPRGSTRNKGQR